MNHRRHRHLLLTEWCSLHHYYENISINNLSQNFKTLHDGHHTFPCDLRVVDDNYVKSWDVWNSTKPKAFWGCGGANNDDGGTLRILTDSVRSKSMILELWLAPVTYYRHSNVKSTDKYWVLRKGYNDDRPSNSSHCWKLFYGLDLDATRPLVLEHFFQSINGIYH